MGDSKTGVEAGMDELPAMTNFPFLLPSSCSNLSPEDVSQVQKLQVRAMVQNCKNP
jgi:hypothetical protein